MRSHMVFSAFAAATMLVATALPSAAATIDSAVDPSDWSFGGIAPTGSIPTGSGDPNNPFSADFDYFSFSTGAARVGASVKTTGSSVSIVAVQIVTSDGQVLDQAVSFGKSLLLSPILLQAGDYYVSVRAVGGDMTAFDAYSGQLSVSQVPLPSSLALLGSALLGCATLMAAGRKAGGFKARKTERTSSDPIPVPSSGHA